jgi:hypothetical protein
MSEPARATDLFSRHMAFGWWTLLLFLLLGMLLDAMHGLKIGLYLDVSNATRRLLWTLAHAHGALLALVHIAFAWTLRSTPFGEGADRGRGLASACLIAASVLMPSGFFLGGAFVYGGDPGVGAFLVPVGGALLLVGFFLTARGVASGRSAPAEPLAGHAVGGPDPAR